jgi:hypothetical protein
MPPSTSPKQKRVMAAISHGWSPPKGSSVAKIPKNVAEDFFKADQAKARREGRDKGARRK